MGRVRGRVRKLTKAPGVPQARHIAERTVAPYLRADVHQLGLDHAQTVQRLSALEQKVQVLVNAVSALESHQPTILNAIASTNGTARLLARELNELRNADQYGQLADQYGQLADKTEDLSAAFESSDRRIDAVSERLELAWESFQSGDDRVRGELKPHITTIGWLLERIEVVRAEMMNEIRYGARTELVTEPKIINAAFRRNDVIRVNLGAGHIPIDGFVNVDMRELPGIDVVATVDSLPFEPGSVTEIFSSHTIEHFPQEQLKRKLLPYWRGLLRPGGTVRAVVPDLEAMTTAYARGEITFEAFRAVAYGGQEYEGDFHFNGFTPDSLSVLLIDGGFEDPQVIERGRPNGDCLEFEIAATKPVT